MAQKLTAQREDAWPYYWVVRSEDGVCVDRDKYSNDLRERWCPPNYDLTFVKDTK